MLHVFWKVIHSHTFFMKLNSISRGYISARRKSNSRTYSTDTNSLSLSLSLSLCVSFPLHTHHHHQHQHHLHKLVKEQITCILSVIPRTLVDALHRSPFEEQPCDFSPLRPAGLLCLLQGILVLN